MPFDTEAEQHSTFLSVPLGHGSQTLRLFPVSASPVILKSDRNFGQHTLRLLERWLIPNLLEIEDLTVCYALEGRESQDALRGISFSIRANEIVGLMGESGCGKSTTALAVLGLLSRGNAEVRGSIRFRGEELLGKRERDLQKIRGATISLVYQEPELALHPMIAAGEQIAEVLHAHSGKNWKRCREEAEQSLARVGFREIERISSAYPHQLSGGQRQRVCLAQAIACRPALLIADEPTAALDAHSQAQFIELLRELREETGLSILLISHSPEIQARLADRILVMRAGEIIDTGTLGQLAQTAANASTRALLQRTNSHARLSQEHLPVPTGAALP